MASYSVTIFINTGFNAVNIPDSPELLSSCTYITCDSIQTLQQRFLSSVNVRVSWNSIQDADYAKIGDFYYFITSIAMLSAETAQLSLTPDFITSCGGLKNNSNLIILDGITERQTVSDDTWGKYSEEDPLTVPQEPLQLETTWGDVPTSTVSDVIDGDAIFVESTIDLGEQAAQNAGVTYTDDLTGNTVTVPQINTIGTAKTNFEIGIHSTVDESTTVSNGTKVYCRNDSTTQQIAIDDNTTETALAAGTTVAQGMAKARSLGVEGSIISQWRVPQKYLGDLVTIYTYTHNDDSSLYYTVGDYQTIGGVSTTCSIDNNITSAYATPKNNRVLYGQYNAYTIMTAAGNSLTCKPEEIMNEAGIPSVFCVADPRPDGRPYYRFTTINNNTDFWRNCVAGEQWAQVPLVYQEASSTALNRLNFNNSQGAAAVNYQYTDAINTRQATAAWQANQYQIQLNNLSMAQNTIGTLLGTGTGTASDYASSMSTDMVGIGLLNRGANAFMTGTRYGLTDEYYNSLGRTNQALYDLQSNQLYAQYAVARSNELSQLYQANTIWTPTVVFPYNASIIRDVKGNGFLLYKWRYSDTDVARIDKILTMYGYKESEPVTKDNFNRRTHFDYVACQSISISGFPRWFNEGIAMQLRNGVRIWHELPNVAAYIDNPIAI